MTTTMTRQTPDDGTMSDSYREVIDLLYGGGGDELIEKMSPDQSEVHINGTQDRKRRRATAGLSAVGATAGVAGLGLAAKETRTGYKDAVKAGVPKGMKAFKAGTSNKKLATALVPLEVAGLGGELMATHILHNDTKKKTGMSTVKKDIKEIPTSAQFPKSKGELTRAVAMKGSKSVIAAHKKGTFKKLPDKVRTLSHQDVHKSETYDVTWSGEFSKVDADKRQVFGWASVVEKDGEPVVDLQGDYISLEEVEKSAYEYVHKSRKGGDMHLRDGDVAVHKSDMIESFVITPEKKTALGMADSTPTGWWVGYQINDEELWNKVKSGERTGFSIHGRGVRS